MNNYEDYYGYMNYMTGNTVIPNDMGIGNIDMNYQPIINNPDIPNYTDIRTVDVSYQPISNDLNMVNYQNIANETDVNTYQDGRNFGMNYQTTDNNIFAKNFMMPSANNELLEPKEGLEKGNLFKNQYIPYKNYSSMRLNPTTERQKMLNEILSYGFAMKDLNLYLDMYPNNTTYINLYNQYRKTKDKLVNQYEKQYGPLTLNNDAVVNNNWVWNNSPWPWEGER